MYEAHFGMQSRPFDSGIAQDVDVFRGSQQEAIVGKFKLALAVADSVVTLTGPAGVGKTTIASAALRATSTRLALAWLNGVPTNANELLELLLLELGVNAHRTTRIERLQMWRQFLSEMSATESRVFVIAERTEDLAPEVLRALDSLTAADANGCPGANVVLLGRPGLDQVLALPELDSLRQRIRLRQRLEPFSATELASYLRHRVTSAGGDFDRVFAPGAAAAVYRFSGGIARMANNLCEVALGVAAAERKTALTPELITQVAVEMLGLGEPSAAPAPQSAPAAPTAPVAPSAPAGAAAVTFASVAIDVSPAKAAASVTVPRNASAAPRAAEPAPAPGPTQRWAAVPATAPMPTSAAATPAIATPAIATPVVATPVVPTPAVATPAIEAAAPAPPLAKPAAPAPQPPPVSSAAPAAAPVAAAPAEPTAAVQPPTAAQRPPVIAAPPAAAAAVTAAAAPAPAFPKPAARQTAASDFDATATDIPDVSSFDFPVLTDAVEDIVPGAPVARAAPAAQAPAPRAPAPQAPAPQVPNAKQPVAPAAAARAPSAPAARPAAPPSRPAAAAPTPPPARRLLEPKPSAPPPPAPVAEPEQDADVLRQTQTMRALSLAKSIEDVSDSMAETLFGEADLDFLSAALASSLGESDESQAAAAPEAVAPSVPNAPPPPTSSPVDELMDLFNLGPDAPLELIDDSVTPQNDLPRKTAARRS